MSTIIYLFCFVFLLSGGVFSNNFNFVTTCIKSICFDTRIADTQFARAKGLMGETSLPEDEGMLFFFSSLDYPEFWMKNTKIPLDILYINDEDVIVYMVKHALPCIKGRDCPVYKTTRPASKVLEINGGLSKKYGFHVGDSVEYFLTDAQ